MTLVLVHLTPFLAHGMIHRPQVVVAHGMTLLALAHVLALGMMTVQVRLALPGLAQALARTVHQAGMTVLAQALVHQAGIKHNASP